jgi:uncharacterized protein with GYD domain
MAKYLIKARYAEAGTRGLAHEGGSQRRKVVSSTIEGLGGSVESFYYALGDVDAYIIMELPDIISVMALSLAVNQSGAVTIQTVPLVTPEELDQAGKLVVGYRPPS